MAASASCTYIYTEETFAAYYRARERRNTRMIAGWLAAIGAIISIMAAAVIPTAPGPLPIIMLAIGLALTALGLNWAIRGTMPMHIPMNEAREYFARHGADVLRERPWHFEESVTVDDDGITISYSDGMDRESPRLTLTKGWDEWKRVVETPDFIMVISKGDGSSPLWSLIGFEYLYRREKRNQYEDAVIPKTLLRGMTVDQLRELLDRKLGEANRSVVPYREAARG